MNSIDGQHQQDQHRLSDVTDIYTDGSCFGHVGGWAFVKIRQDQTLFSKGHLGGCDSGIAELKAIFLALSSEHYDATIRIYTDYKPLIDALNSQSSYRLKKLSYLKIYESILQVIQQQALRVDFIWVKSHSKNRLNNFADKLAREAALNKKTLNPNISQIYAEYYA